MPCREEAMQPVGTEKWICVLQKCRRNKEPREAQRLLLLMRSQQLDLHPILCNYLIPALVDCGSLSAAQTLFHRIPICHRHLRSWNSIISGYVRHGHPRHAFMLFKEMQQQSFVQATRITFLALLCACTMLTHPDLGLCFHAQIVMLGIDRDADAPRVGNSLVNMYGRCGLVLDMNKMFHSLLIQDVVSWNVLIAGYTEQGLWEEARKCLRIMEEHGVSPVSITFINCLKACSTMDALGMGQEVHAKAIKRGLETELHLGSAIMAMYAQCGSLGDATHVFNRFSVRDVVTWNALIKCCNECGHAHKPRDCLQRMLVDGICPDPVTLVCSLISCATETGQQVHDEAVKKGFDGDLHVANALVDMYGKCALLKEAQKVFGGMHVRDADSWAALIAGYAEHGFPAEAASCFEQMILQDIPPLPVVFVFILKACTSSQALETGCMLHAESVKRGLESQLYFGCVLVDMYNVCGQTADACTVFDSLPCRDVVSWNVLITGLFEHGLNNEAGKCFFKMILDSIPPDAVTLACILKGCGNTRSLDAGRFVHGEATKRGFERELNVGNMLVDLYANCGLLVEVCKVFDRLQVRSVESWNALITGYVEHGFNQEALVCYERLQQEGLSPDPNTLLYSLKACGVAGAVGIGRDIHVEATKRGLERELYMGSMLVDMYGECGLCEEAHQIFDRMDARSMVSCTALIKAYGKSHQGDKAVECFLEMQEQGMRPSPITFICLLAACSHSCLVSDGEEYFKLMKELELQPTSDHYACMVDLFARSGHVHEAQKFIQGMQCSPSGIIFYTLLSYSKVYGKLELGERCFEQLVGLNQEDASSIFLMAEIYASSGRLEDANRLVDLRKCLGAKKPGRRVIEMNDQVSLWG